MSQNKEQLELYEKARKRIKQKKGLITHGVFLLIGSVFFIILNKFLKFQVDYDWYAWATLAWLFLWCIHAFNVFVTHRFFGKEWQQAEIEKLMSKHHKKVTELEKSLEKKGAFNQVTTEDASPKQ